jgi:enolase
MPQIIKTIKAREILDSRGNPTIEVLAETKDFKVKASVPSGTSKGKNEAKELRDGDPKRYNGLGVLKAVENVNEIIGPKLKGLDPTNQKEIDNILIELDGTKDKSNLGANAIVGVSMAVAKLGAKTQNIPLWQHISKLGKVGPCPNKCLPARQAGLPVRQAGQMSKLPLGAFNIINGGAHAGNDLDIQEFMIVPQLEQFSLNLQAASEVYQNLKKVLKEKFRKSATNIGDEGGFAPPISLAYAALELIMEAVKPIASKEKEIKLILDCAASQLQKQDNYHLEKTVFTRNGLFEFYKDLISKYPIIGLEDPFGEEDWQGFQKITEQLGKNLIIIGDDLLVTNPERIKQAKKLSACNGAIIKINQIGTVSEAIEAANLAKSFGWKIIVSHRSGETCDDFIADFAVGVGADFIKAGAPARGERVAKYNRLLEIEEELTK